ncbi:protein SAAL1 isoform X3 [Eleutherodactylus coqui]|uniref:protein SAAL1 isoform X3 n=1 Tax=Eleutherodactylus coqui TaxID=57060 RepID=UPI003462A741
MNHSYRDQQEEDLDLHQDLRRVSSGRRKTVENPEKNKVGCSPKHPETCDMDRNPSPPSSDDEEGQTEDSIGSTVYSKHWLFSTLTRLIELVTKRDKSQSDEDDDDETPLELDEDMENAICKVWDMSMNEEVALFLKEFNAPEIFLGIISKSKCNRLTEICVGILGNMACFQETCAAISEDELLGEVLLLLMCDPDPPTLLETTRLLLTCVSRADVMNTWLERIRKRPSVRDNLCFIMSSSTNGELLVKVGELVDKLFDVDEELMIGWIKAGCAKPDTRADGEEEPGVLGLVPSLLEAAKQLKYDSPEGLDVYLHILQLVTTVDEGIQAIDLPLIGSLTRILGNLETCQKKNDDKLRSERDEPRDSECEEDFHLQILKDVCCEFLANLLSRLTKENILEALMEGHITEEKSLCALRSLLPLYAAAVDRFIEVLGEADRPLSETLKNEISVLRGNS